MNLGQETAFPDTADDVNPIVMNGISTSTVRDDSLQVGNGYRLGQVEAMEDDDYSFSTEIKGTRIKMTLLMTENSLCRQLFLSQRLFLFA